jgi:hypothetical protein
VGYNHGLISGQTVTIQLDPGASYPKNPFIGLNAVAYSTQPKVYNASNNNLYYVNVLGNGDLQFATSAQNYVNGIFETISEPFKATAFRVMPTLQADWVPLSNAQKQIENVGIALSFPTNNQIQVDKRR